MGIYRSRDRGLHNRLIAKLLLLIHSAIYFWVAVISSEADLGRGRLCYFWDGHTEKRVYQARKGF